MATAVGTVAEECVESVRSLYSEAEEQSIETCQDRLRELSDRLAAERALAHGVTAGPVCDKTVNKVARSAMRLMPMADVGGGGKVTIEWGGKEGTQIRGNVSVEVKDDKGRHIEVEYSKSSEGTSKIDVSGKAEPRTKESNREK